ncbi:MAG: acyl-CoA dehydrogenase family protein, partial [Gaiellaceae bacterium]
MGEGNHVGAGGVSGTRLTAEGTDALARMRAFIAEVALPRVAAFELEHPDTAFALEPDGRLAEPLYALKIEMQQLSASEGLYCPHLPPPDGLGLGFLDCMHLHEEVFGHGIRGQQWTLAWTEGPSPLVRYWSTESRERVLPDFLGGKSAVCFALTEASAGSDFPALETTAVRDGSGWRLSGAKHLITGAPQAGFAQVFARVDDAPRGEL